MDPVTLATAAVATLTPYLAKASEEFAKEAGKKGFATAEALLKALWGRWRGNSQAASRLQQFVTNPDVGRESFTLALVAEVASDKPFADALQALLNGAPPEVFVDQTAKNVRDLTGAEIKEIVRGHVTINQDVEKADNVIGAKIDRLG